MKILNLIQGTPEWHAHRAKHFNASDAPAMMGESPYETRSALIARLATGVTPPVDSFTQALFDEGHRFEALARPLAEQIIKEELYPCVGTLGKYSASFDGLTMDGLIAFEHKRLNNSIRAILDVEDYDGSNLPLMYRIQMEHQHIVSGAQRVLFMATLWRDQSDVLQEQIWCWYKPDPELRARIVAGWNQLEKDVAAYKPDAPALPAPIGKKPRNIIALRVDARGVVTSSNLAEFKSQAMAELGAINRVLVTDEDFSDAQETVKWCSGVEEKLDATKANIMAQMNDVKAIYETIDGIKAETRKIRLEVDKLITTEKDRRKAEIIKAGVDEMIAYYAELNATLGDHALPVPKYGWSVETAIRDSIKGLKTIDSMRDRVRNAVANAKIDADRKTEFVRVNVDYLQSIDAANSHLFPDAVSLCSSLQVNELRKLAADRVDAESKRRIAADELAKAAAKLELEKEQALKSAILAEATNAETVQAATRQRVQEFASRVHGRDAHLASAGAFPSIGSSPAMTALAEQAKKNDEAMVLMPLRLTAEDGAKYALSGEFNVRHEINEGIIVTIPIPWTTIKDIYAAAVKHFHPEVK